jgi:hypothetical protein
MQDRLFSKRNYERWRNAVDRLTEAVDADDTEKPNRLQTHVQ